MFYYILFYFVLLYSILLYIILFHFILFYFIYYLLYIYIPLVIMQKYKEKILNNSMLVRKQYTFFLPTPTRRALFLCFIAISYVALCQFRFPTSPLHTHSTYIYIYMFTQKQRLYCTFIGTLVTHTPSCAHIEMRVGEDKL